MKIIFQIDGGVGKNIAATAVCKAIHKQYPNDELIVVTNYPAVFFCNPYISRILGPNDLVYFYRDYIEGRKIKLLLQDPFLETDFIIGNTHLIQVWCEMFGIKYDGELPQIYLTDREKIFYGRQFSSAKPVMLIQSNGGSNQQIKYSWSKDIPAQTAQKVVNAFVNEFHVVHIKREDQQTLQGTTPLQSDIRAIAVLITLSEKRLFINSFAQHAAAALGKHAVVCWVGNSPVQLGYELHTNIIANQPTLKPELRHSVFSKYNVAANATEFPYNSESEVFDADEIIEVLRNNENEKEILSKRYINIGIANKINADNNGRNLVAGRLASLVGKTDLSNVTRILDIGSRDLYQSLQFARIFESAKIDAFEPVPDSYQTCLKVRDSLDSKQKEQVNVHNVALSTVEGEIPFYSVDPLLSSTPNIGASSMFKFIDGLNGTPFGQNLIQQEIIVKSDTLDNWCAKNNVAEIDIIWIDVQGAELLVFQGGEKILRNTKIIMTEVGLKSYYEGHTLKTDIDKYLFNLGFKELEGTFELNGFDYEANTIYVRDN